MGRVRASTDPSPVLSPRGDSLAPGGPEAPLTHGGEAALHLRSSELGWSLQEEPPAQALATSGQTIDLPNWGPSHPDSQKHSCLGSGDSAS